MKYMDPIDVKRKMDEGEPIIILDVREPYELEICRVQAMHIPMAEISSRVKELPSDQQLVVMCKSGQRASAVANLLTTDFQLNNIWVLNGGILAWIEQVDQQLEQY